MCDFLTLNILRDEVAWRWTHSGLNMLPCILLWYK